MSAAIVPATNSKQYSGFSPRSVPSCLLWFDAADTSTIVATGSTVTQWNDKSGNATHMTTAIGSPQTGTTTTNGLNTMDLTAGGYFRRPTGFTFPAQYSVFTVAFTNATGLTTLLSTGGDLAFLYRFPNSILWGNGAGFWNTFTTNIPSAPLALIEVTNTGSAGTLYTNGSFRETVSGSTVSRTGFAIGNRMLNYTEPWNGYVCEVLVFNTVISTGQRQAVEGYLARKWGLTGSLPETHPYKSLPPFTRPFQPSDISDCTLWLDASDRNTITSAGSAITQWNDKSGGGFNATATTGPTVSTYNGYPVVSFDGSSQFMSSAHTIPRSTHTLIAVHRPAVITGNRQGNTSLFRYQGPNNYVVFPYMNDTTPRGYVTNANASLSATTSPLVEISVTTAFNLIMAVIVSGRQFIYKNGSSQISRTFALTTTPVSDALTIGRFPTGASEYYQGDLAEMIVYSRNLATGERQLLEGYLAWKWGLQATLPATQPFRLFRTPTVLFNPLQISGCSLWLDAADSNTFTFSSGSNISQWRDKSGNANHASAYTGTTTLSNQGVVFTGNQALNTPLSSVIPNQTGFIILSHASGTGTLDIMSLRYNSGTCPGIQIVIVNNVQMIREYGGATRATGATLTQNTRLLYGYNYVSAGGAGTAVLYNNGTQTGSNSATSPTLSGSGTLLIGAYADSGASYELFVGTMNEIILFNSILTTQQRQQVEGYLAWKWGLQTKLSSSHAYYDTRA